jgi:hypothetical protein
MMILRHRFHRMRVVVAAALSLAFVHCSTGGGNNFAPTLDDTNPGASSGTGSSSGSGMSSNASGVDATTPAGSSSGASPTPSSSGAPSSGASSSGASSSTDAAAGASSSGASSSGAPSSTDAAAGDDASTEDSSTGSSSGPASVDDGGTSSGDDAGEQAACAPNTTYPQTSFINLGVTPGQPLSQDENDPIPMADAGAPVSAPAGWNFYGKDGAVCRDGSPAGFYVHFANPSSSKLFIYLEGGGACDSATFCSHNPANIGTVFSGGADSQGQTIGGSLTFVSGPQQPYVPIAAQGLTAAVSPGIFDFTQSANPFQTWNGVYIPYCTGDVHFGTADGVTIPGQDLLPALTNQHFVGHLNFEKFLARIVPTFPNLSQVVLTGASAGGFAAGLSYGLVQDSFGPNVPVSVIDDSGPPFSEQYLPACLQKEWRQLWGFDAALPSDCTECFQEDGSGLTNIVYYWLHKYPQAKVAFVSTMQDEVIRLFFSQGDNSCASNDATSLDVGLAAGNDYTGAEYTSGLDDLVSTFQCTGRLATYFIGGQNPNYMHPTHHQHIFRDEFYQAITNDGGTTMAQWATDFVQGNLQILGP